MLLDDNLICGQDRMLVLHLDWDLERKNEPAPDWVAKEVDRCKTWVKVNKIISF